MLLVDDLLVLSHELIELALTFAMPHRVFVFRKGHCQGFITTSHRFLFLFVSGQEDTSQQILHFCNCLIEGLRIAIVLKRYPKNLKYFLHLVFQFFNGLLESVNIFFGLFEHKLETRIFLNKFKCFHAIIDMDRINMGSKFRLGVFGHGVVPEGLAVIVLPIFLSAHMSYLLLLKIWLSWESILQESYYFQIIMNSKYADTLQSLKNSGLSEIPAFPNDAFERAIMELNEANSQLKQLRKKQKDSEELTDNDKLFLTAKSVVKIDTIYRLKRFMLVLLENRCRRIGQQFWSFGGEIKPTQLPNLSQKQKGYLLGYKNLVNNYIDDLDLELMMDLEPPIDTVVEIRVVRDCSQIVELAEQGIKLQKNSVHFIQKRLVEKLIIKGDVVVIG